MKPSGRGWAQTGLEAVSATVAREDLIYKTGSESSSYIGQMCGGNELRLGKQNRTSTYPGIRKYQPWTPSAAQTMETLSHLVLGTSEAHDHLLHCSHLGILSPPVRRQPSFIPNLAGTATLLPPVNNGGSHLWKSRTLLYLKHLVHLILFFLQTFPPKKGWLWLLCSKP